MRRFFLLLAGLVIPLQAYAQETGEIGESMSKGFWKADPWWFPLLEIGGVILAVTIYVIIRHTTKHVGGIVGKGFTWIKTAQLLFILALIIKAYTEITELDGFFYDLIFELPLYAGIIMIAYGAKHFASLSKGG